MAAALPSLLLSACGERPHLNPFDPATKVALEIKGPDSLTMAGDTARFTVVTDPEYLPVAPAEWTVQGGSVNLRALGDGRFVLFSAPLAPTRVLITATLDGRTAQTTMMAVQHVTQLHLACGDVTTYSYNRLGASVPLCPAPRDARGNWINSAISTFVARTPGVVNVVPGPSMGSATVVGYGSTWVVATAGGISDSVRISATETLQTLSISPACNFFGPSAMHVGDTVTFRVDRPGIDFDSNVMPVADSALAFARASSTWYRAQPDNPLAVEISASGTAIARAVGWDDIIDRYRLPGEDSDRFLRCMLQVVQ